MQKKNVFYTEKQLNVLNYNICDSPFGVTLQNRDYSSEKYRYGYQKSEKDDEVKGKGNSYSTFYRQLDTRIGRWLTVDPKFQALPSVSPFISMDNNPIWYCDPVGDYVPTKISKRALRKEKIDKYGVPEKVQKTFNKEYGIRVQMVNGNLTYAGEYEEFETKETVLGGGYKTEVIVEYIKKEGPVVSPDAKAMMMDLLDPNKKAEISYNFNYKKHDRGEISPFYTNLTQKSKNYRTSYFNLGAVNDDLSLKIVDNSVLTTPEARRSFNFGRVLEHESLHGITLQQDFYWYSDVHYTKKEIYRQFKIEPGPIVETTNKFARQMGLENYQRLIYRNEETGNTILGNPAIPSSQFNVKMNKNF